MFCYLYTTRDCVWLLHFKQDGLYSNKYDLCFSHILSFVLSHPYFSSSFVFAFLISLFPGKKKKVSPSIPTWMSSHPDHEQDDTFCARPQNSFSSLARFKQFVPPEWVQVLLNHQWTWKGHTIPFCKNTNFIKKN